MSPATSPAKTTQARLQAVINQSRQIMRKDAGLNGDVDRLPQLAWLLFLKAFDDLEEEREAMEAGYRPVLAEEFRWRTWASGSDTTGDPLLVFVNSKLLPKLRGSKRQATRATPATRSRACSRTRQTGCCRGTFCASSSTRSTRSSSPTATRCTPWRCSTRPCCARCETPQATRASSTRRVR